jgi:hypothetical protein
MSLEGLAGRADAIGERAAMCARDQIMLDAQLPSDVKIETGRDGIILSGRRLRRRMIEDSRLRNFARKGQIKGIPL